MSRTLFFCLVSSFAVAAPASAAATASDGLASGPDTTVVQQFDLPSRPVAEALADFSRQSGLRVSFREPARGEITSMPVSGRFTPSDALRRLLAGTGLTARFADAESVVVSAEASAAYALRPVVVTGAATRTAGYAPRRTTTATKTDTPLLSTPQSVTLVTREVIEDQAMQSLSHVVRYVPGVTMGLGEGHRDQPTIRGVNSTADFFVDGVRDDAQYYRDVYNVDRVEALKGPNAMIFGRGGGGGVINRVLKQPQWAPVRTLRLEGGAYDHRRATLDAGQGFGQRLAARVNAVAERSRGFREHARIERRGLNPTAAIALGANTTLRAAYEDFEDERFVDRGVPSYQGKPAPSAIETFFGNPSANESRAAVRMGHLSVDHSTFGGLTLRSRTQLADYDKFYANTLPGAVNVAGTQVSLSGYNSSMLRHNAFNQTEMVYATSTGRVAHLLMIGGEFARQRTSAVRNTAYWNGTATALNAPFDAPSVSTPLEFRPSASDPNARTVVRTRGFYAQDQLAIGEHLDVHLGVRHDRFSVDYRNNRNGQELSRDDDLLSPRFGVVVKPTPAFSLYGSYSLSHLPSAGDQFTALSATTRGLEPERFVNREVGIKWALAPRLVLTTALYRLDHTNAAAPHPTDPGIVVQTGRQRMRGVEGGLAGSVTDAWQVLGGFSAQHGRVVSATTASPAGATIALLPARTFSLWNRLALTRFVAFGMGVVHQSEMYAAIDNKVTLPAFTRVDGALYLSLLRGVHAQVNVENLLDERYYPTSHGNNNIMPGAPRSVRVSLTTGW